MTSRSQQKVTTFYQLTLFANSQYFPKWKDAALSTTPLTLTSGTVNSSSEGMVIE